MRRPFHHEGGRGAPFAAGSQPLHDAQADQQDRRPEADRLIGRQQAEPDRAERHQEDGEHQRRLAAPGVSEAADPVSYTHLMCIRDRGRLAAEAVADM